MTLDLAVTWLLALLPLSLSPGPANVLFAASGGAFGIRSTLPFWIGTNMICLVQSLAVGMGVGALLERYPGISTSLQYVASLFLLYLALRFFRMAIEEKTVLHPLRFIDGVVIELLNLKFLMIPAVLFSQADGLVELSVPVVVGFSLALVLLTMLSNLLWMAGGASLSALLASDRLVRIQGFIFGSMLLTAAIWLTLRAILWI